jgi:hypothetical protein
MWSDFPRNLCPSAHIGGQLLILEGQTCSLGRTFTTSIGQTLAPSVEHSQQAYREERLARYEQVVALRKLGMSHAAIAERVGMGASTESLEPEAFVYPETTRGPYVSRIDPYLPYLFRA